MEIFGTQIRFSINLVNIFILIRNNLLIKYGKLIKLGKKHWKN